MSSANPSSILRQTIPLFNSLHNLRLMIFRPNWFFSIAFLTAVLSASVNSFLYMAIALIFLLFGSLSIAVGQPGSNKFSWRTERGIDNTVILVSLLLICLFIPQVETNMANFSSPIENLEHRTRQS